MKIWMIAQDTRPPEVPGITRHYALGREWASRGDEVLVVHGGFDHLGPSLPEETPPAVPPEGVWDRSYDGVRFLTVPVPPYEGSATPGRLWNNWLFGRRVEKILGGGSYGVPQVVLGSTVHPWAARAGLRLARRFRVPFVFEVRDLWPQTLVELGRISPRHPLVRYFGAVERALAQSADLVVTSAPRMGEYFRERYGLPEERWCWITNGTFVEAFDSSPPEEDEGALEIFYTGTLGRANRLDRFFALLPDLTRRFPTLRFVFVGRGEMRQELEHQGRLQGFPVRFEDPVPKRRVPELLRRASAFLVVLDDLPLYRYGTSLNKMADYHAAGRPVILLGDCAENPLAASGAGWVAPREEDLPGALGALVRAGVEGRRELGRRAREYAREHYDWPRLAERLRSRLEELPLCGRSP